MESIKNKLVKIINEICELKGYPLLNPDEEGLDQLKLRDDIGFDSICLAQLTVYVEEEFGIDIFENGIVNTIGEVIEKLTHE
jgi:acyl carrier protein